MASPLILKIQAQLDKKGFTNFQKQLAASAAALGVVGVAAGKLRGVLRTLLPILVGVGAAIVAGKLVRLAIDQERAVVRLANTLGALGAEGEATAQSLDFLTREMSKTSQFARRDLLPALTLLFRRTRDTNLALRDLAIAQELAATTGESVEQSARAIQLAQSGLAISLANVTGLTVEEIKRFRELGTLTDELERRFPIGVATARDLDTIAASLDRVKNRVQTLREELGKDLFDLVRPALKGVLDLLNSVPDSVIEFGLLKTSILGLGIGLGLLFPPLAIFINLVTVGITVLRNFSDETEKIQVEGELLAARFGQINKILALTGDARTKAFETTREELNAIETSVQFFREQLALVVGALEAKRESGELTTEENISLLLRKGILEDLIKDERARRTALRETEETIRRANETTLKDQVEVFVNLNISRREQARREIDIEFQKLEAVRRLNRDNNDVLKIIEQQRINNRIRALKLEREIIVEAIEDEISARRRLFNLLQGLQPTIDPEATRVERSRELDRLLRLRRSSLLLIKDEEITALAILNLERDRAETAAERAAIDRRIQVIEATAAAKRIQAEQEFADAARDLGEIEGRPDVAERTERRIITLRREQEQVLADINRQRQKEISASRELQRIDENIETVLERNEEKDAELLARLIKRASVLREIVSATIIPTDEEAIDNITEEIERKLEISKFQVNINLNVDRVTLLSQIDTILTQRLADAGLLKAESEIAPTEPDAPPTDPLAAFAAATNLAALGEGIPRSGLTGPVLGE